MNMIHSVRVLFLPENIKEKAQSNYSTVVKMKCPWNISHLTFFRSTSETFIQGNKISQCPL